MDYGTNSENPRTVVPQIFCRLCASPLVQAADWSREDESRWTVRLWCPECGLERTALLDRAQVVFLSLAVEEGFARMLEALAGSENVSPADAGSDIARRLGRERIEPPAD